MRRLVGVAVGSVVMTVLAACSAGSATTTTTKPARPVYVDVFLRASASRRDVVEVGQAVAAGRSLVRCRYLNHEASYRYMRRIFRHEPQIYELLQPSTTPTLFSCYLRPGASLQDVAHAVSAMPGVLQVVKGSGQQELLSEAASP